MCEINKLNPTQTCDAPGAVEVKQLGTEYPALICPVCFSRRYDYRPTVAPNLNHETREGHEDD